MTRGRRSSVKGRDGDAAERLAFYGDKILNLSVARALYAQQMLEGGDATTLSVGQMSVVVAAARRTCCLRDCSRGC